MEGESNRAPLIIVLDVDGVTRAGVTDAADPKVLLGVRQVVETCRALSVPLKLAFVSGTPCGLPETALPEWFAGNAPLAYVFGDNLNDLVADGTVQIFGQVGGDVLTFDASTGKLGSKTVFGFSEADVVEGFAKLLETYHVDVASINPAVSKDLGGTLEVCIAAARARIAASAPCVAGAAPPQELEPYVLRVRETFDPKFRIVSNGAAYEYHDFITCGLSSHATPCVATGYVNHGIAHRDGEGFRFVLVTATTKGHTVARIRDESVSGFGAGLAAPHLVTVGDTGIDYPMHVLADSAFHVGLAEVWHARVATPAEKRVMWVHDYGVSGTAAVLGAVAVALQQNHRDFAAHVPQFSRHDTR